MIQCNYPHGRKIYITKETIRLNSYTFDSAGCIAEPTSVDYFFRLIESKGSTGTFVDIGAQSGLYSLYSKFYPQLNVYSFEPYTPSYQLLAENLKLNQIEDVKTLCFG